MRTRHEQMQAYRFVTRRIISGMLSGEPETTEMPMRRLGLSLVGSFIVAAIVLAAVGIYGFINPSGGKPAENEIIIMRETGARFVFVGGRLHPVLNFTSAQLIVGAREARQMSQKTLQKVPRGQPLGIPGAPDPVPSRKALLALPWSVCTGKTSANTNVRTVLHVGRAPARGTALGAEGLLVTTGSGADLPMYLLLGGLRLKIDDRTVLTALEMTSTAPARVTSQLLNSIPAGPDLSSRPVRFPNAGASGARTISGQPVKIGQVYRSGQQAYIGTPSGLAPIGEVMSILAEAGGQRAQDITAKQAADALSAEKVQPEGFPEKRWTTRSGDDLDVCAVYRADAATGNRANTGRLVDVEHFPVGTTLGPEVAQSQASARDGARTADQVLVEQGHGALVRSLPVAGVSAETTVHLVTDQGLSFALGVGQNGSAQDALGYGGLTPTPIPAAMLALIPAGPDLNPDKARQFLPLPGASASAVASPTPTPSPSPSPSVSPTPSRTGSPSASVRPSTSTPSSPKPSSATTSRRAAANRTPRRRRGRHTRGQGGFGAAQVAGVD